MRYASALRRIAKPLLAVAMVIPTSDCIGRILIAAEPRPEELSPAARLGSYEPGMNLRETFDSLSPTAHPAEIELLEDNIEAWRARWEMVAAARSTIDIDYFIFSQDLFGLALLGHLADKARHGVRVRLQLDAQGLVMSNDPYDLDCLPFVGSLENVSVRKHRSLSRRIFEAIVRFEPTLATASDHDKVIVVDRRMSMVGGRNIEAKYFAHPADLPDAFHDVDILLEGTGVSETLTEVFETTYDSNRVVPVSAARPSAAAACGTALDRAYRAMDAWLSGRPFEPDAAETIDGSDQTWESALRRWPRLQGAGATPRRHKRIAAETRVLDSVPRPGSARDAVTRSLMRLFDAATDNVLMESPYVVLTEGAAEMLATTSDHGVDMLLLTNSPLSTDNRLSQIYFREQWPRLLATVPRLRLFACGTTHNIHSKYVVFDNQLTLVGSYNLDPFSMLVSGEVMVAAWSRQLAEHIATRPRAMIARGAPEVYEYTIERDANGEPVRNSSGAIAIDFGPADHTDAAEGPLYGFRWALLRAVPWLAGLPPFF